MKVGAAVGYFISFGAGRACLFAAPLMLANLMDIAAYALVETALAAATILYTLLTLGTLGLAPIVLLKKTTEATFRGVVVHALALSAGCAAFACLAWFGHVSPSVPLTAMIAGAMTMQALVSVQLKTLGSANAAVLVESGLMLSLVVGAVCAWFAGGTVSNWLLISAAAFAAVPMIKYFAALSTEPLKSDSLAWKATVRMSVPLMLGGLVSTLAASSGRLFMGVAADTAAAASYAVLARAAALPVAAHQLFVVYRFRDLFTLSEVEVERAVLWIIAGVSLAALAFGAASGPLAWMLGDAFERALEDHRAAGLLVASQTVLWSAIALNDLLITRSQLMPKIWFRALVFLASSFLCGVAGWHVAGKSLFSFVLMHSTVMLAFHAFQCWRMARLGIPTLRIWSAAAGSFVLLSLASVWVA
jgi:hypothetical protein